MNVIAVNQEDRRFFVFNRIWCISTLFHLASFSYWSANVPIAYFITLVSCLLHLLIPSGNRFFYCGLAGSVLLVWLQIPNTPNHIFFEWFLNVMFAFVLLSGTFNFNQREGLHSYFFGKSLTATRWSLIFLYFFVVLHKLNYDFYDPYSSCGAVLFEEIFQRSGIFRVSLLRDFYYNHELFFKFFSIWLTIVAELVIPIMLIIRKWRNAGLVFGILFHLLLSLHGHNGIFSFSAMLFTIFIFFWNDTTVNFFYEKWNYHVIMIKTLIVISVGLTLAVYIMFSYTIYVLATLLIWYLYAVVYMVLFLQAISGNYADTYFSIGGKYVTGIAWIIPFLIFLNGISPYLGLKTEACFSMFSNLRTEGNISNHQFIPVSWQIFNYQKELVSIKNTNYERLKNLDLYHGKNVLMVKFEFVKILDTAPDNIFVEYEINGREGYFEKSAGKIIHSDIDLRINPILRKWFYFRLVHTDKSLCKH